MIVTGDHEMVENKKIFVLEGNIEEIQFQINEIIKPSTRTTLPLNEPSNAPAVMRSDIKNSTDIWDNIDDFKLEQIGTNSNNNFIYMATLIVSKK